MQSPWENKQPRAVFRGATTSFDLKDLSWGACLRLRLHQLSDAIPDLLDARVSRWSHAGPEAKEAMEADGITLAKFMDRSEYNSFKYQVRLHI